MDRKYIDEHHIVARYLADQLSDAEREAFEAYYLEHPEMVREMEATARFKAGLASLADRGELTQLINSRPARSTGHWLALAAAVTAVAIGVTYFVRTSAPPSSMVARMEALNLPIGITVRVERTRGLADVDFELPPAGTAVALQIAPDFEANPPMYRVSLTRESDDDARPQAELDRVAADDGIITVYLDRSTLERGVYRLSVEGAEGTDAADQRADFRIQAR